MEANERVVRIMVPDAIHQLWIEMNYLLPLQDALQAITGVRPECEFVADPSAGEVRPEGADGAGAAVAADGGGRAVPAEAGPSGSGGVDGGADGAVAIADIDRDRTPAEGLTPDRTFETFVVGANNAFAHAAAMAAAQRPGRAYNPLFLYGGTGLGKTHLMQAIGAYIQKHRRRMRVVYITSEEFTNQFIAAIQDGSLVKFRRRFREADVLLIDDVQFLAGKERSQEEFFHTFNALSEANKQIVLTCDTPPAEVRHLEARLVSRFDWGLTVELTAPDEETRVAILRKRAEAMQVNIAPEVLEYVAARVHSNIRRLHGALIRIASWVSLHGPITIAQTDELLRDVFREEAGKRITIDQIQRRVAERNDIRLADMMSRKRPAHIAQARQVAMYLSRDLTGLSYQEIGDAFGGRDHGTVMHACRTIEQRLRKDEEFRRMVEKMTADLRRGV